MNRAAWLGLLIVLALPFSSAMAGPILGGWSFDRAQRRLHGTLIDYTRNHGADRRNWSPALKRCYDMYVYLPPCYDPAKRYPLMLWLHGFAQDEHSFIVDVAPRIDAAIARGQLPPMIVAAPDGSLRGRVCYSSVGSFYINSKAGCFEDYVMRDVLGFLLSNYSVRPEREAHAIAGVSMGGGGAYTLALKHHDFFKNVVGIYPPVNTRWENCRGRYMADFDPAQWGWREDFTRGLEVVGRFYGVLTVRSRQVLGPLYDRNDPELTEKIASENPADLLMRLNIRPGQMEMYIGYGGRDEFNIDAQVESYLAVARQRGLCVTVGYEPDGRHNLATAVKLLPPILDWLNERLRPYAP